MGLHIDRVGAGRPLVMVHGFTQNSACWGPFASQLTTTNELILVDAPGHGRSNHDADGLKQAAADVVESAGSGVYLGYSMGGRIALHAALEYPNAVSGLVLIGATAGIRDEGERRLRMQSDNELADQLLTGGLEEFLARWLDLPLFQGLPPEAQCLPARLQNRPEGLAMSLRRCGTGSQEPLWPRLEELKMPILVLAGSRDAKFCSIGRDLVENIGANATFVMIEGNHAVHLEAPTATSEVVSHFLETWSVEEG